MGCDDREGTSPAADSDGDGVPDAVDRCPGVKDRSLFAPVVDAKGCPVSVIPWSCRSDGRPPEFIFGRFGPYSAGSGVEVYPRVSGATPSIELVMPDGLDDVTIEDECEELRAELAVVVRSGDYVARAACPLTRRAGSISVDDGERTRRLHPFALPKAQACVVLPSETFPDDVFRAALANGRMEVVAVLQAVDGAGHRALARAFEGKLPVCGARFERDSSIRRYSMPCEDPCPDDPDVFGHSLFTIDRDFEPLAAEVDVGNPVLTLGTAMRISAGGCAVNASARVTGLAIDGRELPISERLCVVGEEGRSRDVRCQIALEHLQFRAGETEVTGQLEFALRPNVGPAVHTAWPFAVTLR